MITAPLLYSLSTKADASGNAQIQMGPNLANETWQITQRTIKSTGAPIIPLVIAYRNAIADAFFVDETINGSFGTSEDLILLQTGEIVIFVWSGAAALAICTATIRGFRQSSDALG